MLSSAPKPKPCAACEKEFTPQRMGQKVCSPKCAHKLVKQAKAEEKSITKARKEKAKSRAEWLKEAQAAFNAYIRKRDEKDPCISCRRYHGGQWHAGHFFSVGARPELRFDENNVHKQCQPCNTSLHGNLLAYRVALLEKIGADALAALEAPRPAAKWTIEELKAIKSEYRRRVKEMEP